jgi:histidyl-tRNA synthetase
MKYADAIKVPYVCILGENEIAAGKMKLKDMKSGEESLVASSEAASVINASD